MRKYKLWLWTPQAKKLTEVEENVRRKNFIFTPLLSYILSTNKSSVLYGNTKYFILWHIWFKVCTSLHKFLDLREIDFAVRPAWARRGIKVFIPLCLLFGSYLCFPFAAWVRTNFAYLVTYKWEIQKIKKFVKQMFHKSETLKNGFNVEHIQKYKNRFYFCSF